MFHIPDAAVHLPPCVPPPHPPGPHLLLFYLRSLSGGLTVCGGASLLSCSVVCCLGFAEAISAAQRDPADRGACGGGGRTHPSSPGARGPPHSLPAVVGGGGGGGEGRCGTRTLFSCRRQLGFCVKASGPRRRCLRGKGMIDVLPLCFLKFNTWAPRGPYPSPPPPPCVLRSPGHARGTHNPD